MLYIVKKNSFGLYNLIELRTGKIVKANFSKEWFLKRYSAVGERQIELLEKDGINLNLSSSVIVSRV
jgi:hypothetical protein